MTMRDTALTIRTARTDEYGAIGPLIVEAYAQVGDVTAGDYDRYLLDVPSWAPGGELLVATAGEDDTDLLGTATFVGPRSPLHEFADTDPDACAIRFLAVRPSAQGSGVGSAIVKACIDRARAAGHPRLRLHTTRTMVGAQRLYERLGFRRDPATDWEPIPGVFLLGYCLELADR